MGITRSVELNAQLMEPVVIQWCLLKRHRKQGRVSPEVAIRFGEDFSSINNESRRLST